MRGDEHLDLHLAFHQLNGCSSGNRRLVSSRLSLRESSEEKAE